MCYKKSVLKSFPIVTRKAPVLESFLNKAASLQACNFIKQRLQQRCSLVNIEKFLRTTFWKKIFERLLLCENRKFSILSYQTSNRVREIYLSFYSLVFPQRKLPVTQYPETMASKIPFVPPRKVSFPEDPFVTQILEGYHQRWRDFKLPRDYRSLT